MGYQKFAVPVFALMIAILAGYYLGYQNSKPDPDSSVAEEARVTGSATSSRNDQADAGSRSSMSVTSGAKLFSQVAGLQNQISALREKYQRLKDKSELDSEEQEELQALPALVKASLDEVPLELITPSIEQYTSIPQDVLENMPDQRAFVERLADVAMEGIVTEPEANPEPILGPVEFSRNAGMAAPQNIFYTTDLVVFAEFDSYSFDETEVLVKWYRVDDGLVFLFKQMPIRNNDRNYDWITNSNGIEMGNYQVEVYQISQDLPLLSAGRYRVESVL